MGESDLRPSPVKGGINIKRI